MTTTEMIQTAGGAVRGALFGGPVFTPAG